MIAQPADQIFGRYAGPAWARWSAAAAFGAAEEAYRAGDRDAAARQCLGIILREPAHCDARHLLGVIALRQGRPADAAHWLGRAARLQPDIAGIHLHHGNALLDLERLEEAAASFHRAAILDPANPEPWNNLGNALKGLGRHDDALAAYGRALAAQPGHAPTLYNLGRLLADLGRFDEATESLRAAIDSAGPDTDTARLGDCYVELGRVLAEQRRYDEALAVMRAMQEIDQSGRAEWHQSLVLLAQGNYAEGWAKYERRYAMADREPPHQAARAIDAGSVSGRRVLVCGEQGHGDTIQFARYVPLLAAAGATVTLSVYPELKPLLAGIDGAAAVIAPGDPEPHFDLATALPSLPLAFHTEVATIPAAVPYLRAPAARLANWRERLGPRREPRVALCWRGSQHIPQRSIPVAVLAPMLARRDVEFHAVQHEAPEDDRAWLAENASVRMHGDDLADFADTAALLDQMDLVVTIDTAVAHLAGALAKPVWVMLPYSADWRWLIDRDDSPWYPSARLFRQQRPRDWHGVVDAVDRALAEYPFAAA